MRTFVAIPLPPPSRSMLSEMQRPLRATAADVRWTAVASIHLTLKFLGEIDPALLPSLKERLQDATAGEPPFSLTLRGLGAFPNLRNPRVVWCGVEGQLDRLLGMQAKVEQVCGSLGFPPEERPFSPHLTLGRVKGPRSLQSLIDCIRIGSPLESRISVDHFQVYKSTLTPGGAVYTVLERIELHD